MEVNQLVWDDDVLEDICNERDRMLIKQIPLAMSCRVDSWFWLLDDKGEFTVKSSYRRLQGEVECPDPIFWKRLWSLKLPGKILNFLWRTCKNVLPTATALAVKSLRIHVFCPWCQIYNEDAVHVLFSCKFAQDLWEAVGLREFVMVFPNETIFRY